MAAKDDDKPGTQADPALPVTKSDKSLGSHCNAGGTSSSSRDRSPSLTNTTSPSNGYPDSPTLGTPRATTDGTNSDEGRENWEVLEVERGRRYVRLEGRYHPVMPSNQQGGGVLLRRTSKVFGAPRDQYETANGGLVDGTSVPPIQRHEPLILRTGNSRVEGETTTTNGSSLNDNANSSLYLAGNRDGHLLVDSIPKAFSQDPIQAESPADTSPESREDGDEEEGEDEEDDDDDDDHTYHVQRYSFVRRPPSRSMLGMMETITERSEESESIRQAISSPNSPIQNTPPQLNYCRIKQSRGTITTMGCRDPESRESLGTMDMANDDRLSMQAYIRPMDLMGVMETDPPLTSSPTLPPQHIQVPPRKVHGEPSMGSIANVPAMSTNLSIANLSTVGERLKQEPMLARGVAGKSPMEPDGCFPMIDSLKPFARFESRSNSMASSTDDKATANVDSLASRWYIPPKFPEENVFQFPREYPKKGKESERQKGKEKEIRSTPSVTLSISEDGPPRIDIPILSDRKNPSRHRRRQRSNRRLRSQTSFDSIGSVLARIPELDFDFGWSNTDLEEKGKGVEDGERTDTEDGLCTPNSNMAVAQIVVSPSTKQAQITTVIPPQQQRVSVSVLHKSIQQWHQQEVRLTLILPYMACMTSLRKRCPFLPDETRAHLDRIRRPFLDFGFEIHRYCMEHVEGYDVSHILKRIKRIIEEQESAKTTAAFRDSGISGMGGPKALEDSEQQRPLSLPPQLQLPPIKIDSSSVNLSPILSEDEPSPVLSLPNALAIQHNTPPPTEEERQVHREESLSLLQGEPSTPSRSLTSSGSTIAEEASPREGTTSTPVLIPLNLSDSRPLSEEQEEGLANAIKDVVSNLSDLLDFVTKLKDTAENAIPPDERNKHLRFYDPALKFSQKHHRQLTRELIPRVPDRINFITSLLSERVMQAKTIVSEQSPRPDCSNIPGSASWSKEIVKNEVMTGALNVSSLPPPMTTITTQLPAPPPKVPKPFPPSRPASSPKTHSSKASKRTVSLYSQSHTHHSRSNDSRHSHSSNKSSSIFHRLTGHPSITATSTRISLRFARAQFFTLHRLSSYPAFDSLTYRSIPHLTSKIERLLCQRQAQLQQQSQQQQGPTLSSSSSSSSSSTSSTSHYTCNHAYNTYRRPISSTSSSSSSSSSDHNSSITEDSSTEEPPPENEEPPLPNEEEGEGEGEEEEEENQSLTEMHRHLSRISAKIISRRTGMRLSCIDTEEKLGLFASGAINERNWENKVSKWDEGEWKGRILGGGGAERRRVRYLLASGYDGNLKADKQVGHKQRGRGNNNDDDHGVE